MTIARTLLLTVAAASLAACTAPGAERIGAAELGEPAPVTAGLELIGPNLVRMTLVNRSFRAACLSPADFQAESGPLRVDILEIRTGDDTTPTFAAPTSPPAAAAGLTRLPPGGRTTVEYQIAGAYPGAANQPLNSARWTGQARFCA